MTSLSCNARGMTWWLVRSSRSWLAGDFAFAKKAGVEHDDQVNWSKVRGCESERELRSEVASSRKSCLGRLDIHIGAWDGVAEACAQSWTTRMFDCIVDYLQW